MPNISFDIFFDQDFINISATRGQTAPKAKPAWKVRSAPKLPPKEPAAPKPGAVRPPQRPKINEGRGVVGKPSTEQTTGRVTELTDAGSQTGDKPPRRMATSWVLGKVSDALAPTVSNVVSSAGGFAGGAINAVGNSVNGIGESINRTVRTYGDGVKDYGNGIMDWTAAGGVRGATANNPLGLEGNKVSGKRSTTSPSVYYPPRESKPLQSAKAASQKKPGPTTPKKAPPATKGPVPVKNTGTPAKAPGVKPNTANTSAVRKPAGPSTVSTGKKTISAASKPQVKKPTTTSAPMATTGLKPPKGAPAGAKTGAKNPLGLAWEEKKK